MKLRFTLRDLLWFTVVVALAVGWWISSLRTAAERPPAPANFEPAHVQATRSGPPQPASPREREKLRNAPPQQQ